VPEGRLAADAVGLYVNGIVVQTLVLCADIVADGLMVTLSANTVPAVHPDEVGVTLYTAVTGLDVVFVSVADTLPGTPALEPDAPGENPVPVGAAHVYVVPVGTIPVGVNVNA
jgi:hypothetical protein